MIDDTYEKETIDITPTWEGLLPALLMVLERGDAKGREEALAELRRMARIADLHVAAVDEQEAQAAAEQESEEDTVDDFCRECGGDNTRGEGYDGLCGNCADRAQQESEDWDEEREDRNIHKSL